MLRLPLAAALILPLLVSLAPPAARADEPHPVAELPLAGFSDSWFYIRSPDNEFQFFPNGRVQIDSYVFARPTDKAPQDTFQVKRARLELFGWVGAHFGFNIAGDFALGPVAAADPVAPAAQTATDDYVLIEPWADTRMIIQVGQFDAPFTLENRLPDKYFDFIERSNTVRAFGVPENKELGMMVHGLLVDRLVYYSAALTNGEGQNFKNIDGDFDVMGRAWIAPWAWDTEHPLANVTLGGSAWFGSRGANGLPLPLQTTAAGFRFLGDRWKDGAGTTLELHQHGDLLAYAFEVDAPILHRYGVRVEFVHKTVDLDEDDVTGAAAGTLVPDGKGQLSGWSFYVEAWAWLIGDDTIVGRPGLQLPPRLEGHKWEPRSGVQLVARMERLDETVTSDTPALVDPNAGETTLTSAQLGVTYWYGRRFRAMFDLALNHFGGDSPAVQTGVTGVLDGGHDEIEALFRVAVAL